MRRRLDLHIGTHKTGSTAIQHVLRRNHAALARAAVWAIEFPAAFQPLMLRTSIDARLVADVRAFLEGAMRQAEGGGSDRRHLLSWEGFSGDPASGYANIDVVAEHVRRITDGLDVRIIVYLRRQDDLVESLYTQRIHEGESIDFATFVGSLPEGSFDWERFLASWSQRFDPSNVLVRRYGAARLAGADGLVADFLATQDLPLEALEHRDRLPRLNRGFSRVALEAARRVNPRLTPEDRQRLRRRLQLVGAKQPFEPYAFFDFEARTAFLQRYAASNARLARMLPEVAGGEAFFPTPVPAAAAGSAVHAMAPVVVDDMLELLVRAMLDGESA